MTTEIPMPEFDQLADVYWRLGCVQSPSRLQGYVLGLLSVGETLEPDAWIETASQFVEAVEPPNEQERQLLLALYGSASTAISADEMALRLLLPDDAVEIPQRIDSVGQWCSGYMMGFAQGGKAIQQSQGQQEYSKEVSEALSDIAAISQIALSENDEDGEDSEQNYFEISEYLRLAAITIYMECHQRPVTAPESSAVPEDNKLH